MAPKDVDINSMKLRLENLTRKVRTIEERQNAFNEKIEITIADTNTKDIKEVQAKIKAFEEKFINVEEVMQQLIAADEN